MGAAVYTMYIIIIMYGTWEKVNVLRAWYRYGRTNLCIPIYGYRYSLLKV